MIIVRDIFVAKPGMASKFAKMMKKGLSKETGGRIMTDLVGDYNTVVMEMQFDNLAEFEKEFEKYKSGEMEKEMSKEDKEEFSHYHEMFLWGKREIFQVFE